MTSKDRFRRWMLACVLLSLATFAASGGGLIPMVGIPFAVLGYALGRGGDRRVLPVWALYALVIGALAKSVLDGLGEDFGVASLGSFLAAVLVLRLWDRRTPKDDGQVLMLAGFLLIGAVLESQAPLMALLLLVTLPALVYAAMLLQVFAGEQKRQAPAPGVPPRALAHLRWILVGTFACGAVVAAGVFVFMPRGLGRAVFGTAITGAGSVTGYTETVRLGRGGTIAQSQANVLDLVVKDAQGNNLGASGRIFYLRGGTSDRYDGRGGWPPSGGGIEHSLPPGNPMYQFRGARYTPGAIYQEVLIRRAGDRTPVFTLWRPIEVQLERPGDAMARDDDLTLTLMARGPIGSVRYKAVSDPTAGGDVQGERTGGIGFESAAVRELAETVLRAEGIEPDPALRPFEDDAPAARAIETYLRDNFAYTLDETPTPGGSDPIEYFLTDLRQGHCEYFASAMTAMLRSVGINARLVKGYVAAEFNDAVGHYVVRESNAHAWVEVEVRAGVWRTFDPTPPADLRAIHEPRPTVLSRLLQLIDAIEYAYIETVVTFDENTQSRLMGAPVRGEWWSDRAAMQLARRVRTGGRELFADAARNALLVSVAVASLGFGVRLLVARRRVALGSSLARGLGPRRIRARHGLYARLQRLLADAGFPRPMHEPPEAHAHALAGTPGEPALAPALRVVAAHYASRFGGRPLAGDERAHAEADLAEVERTLNPRA